MAPSVSHRAKCNHINTDVPVYVYIYVCVTCMYSLCTYSMSVHVCVYVCARLIHLYLVTPLLVTWSHLSCLSLTHRIYLQYPPPTLPERCHSHARLTADIIKAVWPPDMLLAQSRNADQHRATWLWHMNAQYG